MSTSNSTLAILTNNGTTSSTAETELLVFAVYKMVLSPVTVIGNALLVLTGLIDPLKTFQNPSSLFLLAMSTANMFTGIVVAPIFAAVEYSVYSGSRKPVNLAKFGSAFSLLAFNISFGMVFALVSDYFIAVFRPTKYKRCITKQRAKTWIAIVSLIALVFSILPYARVPFDIVLKIDLHFNSTVNSVLLVVSYILLYTAFRNQTKKSLHLQAGNTTGEIQKILTLQKNFGRLLFIFVILSTVPAILSTISYHFMLYCAPCKGYKAITILQRVFLNLTFIKCALDPFAFGWRLARNRRALKKIICCGRGESRQIGAAWPGHSVPLTEL